jgi:ankyrin repeat protein
MSACECGNIEIVKILISAGADLNKASSSGMTPLIYAGMSGDSFIAEILLKHGANPSTRDSSGYNATDWARKKYDGMVAQGFRNLGITDFYDLDCDLQIKSDSDKAYDVFVSYKHLHFTIDADEIRNSFIQLKKNVFVDRYELSLNNQKQLNDEVLKWKLKNALDKTSLTIFFEIFWDGSHGEPKYSSQHLNWQYFELLNSNNAVLLSPERNKCQPLIMSHGKRLKTAKGFKYDNYSDLSRKLVKMYF